MLSRRWSGLRDKLRLCVALLLAAAFTDVLSVVEWRRVGRAVGLWFGWLRGGSRAPKATAEARLFVCRLCPLYWQPLGTCGSPLAKDPKLGCWCQMAEKVKFAEATCWLDDELGEDAAPLGWVANGSDDTQKLETDAMS
jgi:hypothetical protein